MGANQGRALGISSRPKPESESVQQEKTNGECSPNVHASFPTTTATETEKACVPNRSQKIREKQALGAGSLAKDTNPKRFHAGNQRKTRPRSGRIRANPVGTTC